MFHRNKVGDILLDADRGAQILVAPQLADFLCEALVQVRLELGHRSRKGPRLTGWAGIRCSLVVPALRPEV